MDEDVETLRLRMEAAAAAMDFEEARRLRDRISILRGVASGTVAPIDTDGLVRQQPGAMGLGTNHRRVTPPAGWTPPPKPDPLTARRGRGQGGTRTRTSR